MIEKIRSKLVWKTTLVFVAAAMVPFVLISFFFFQNSRKALYDSIAHGLKTETGLMKDAIDARVSLLRSNAMAWAGLEVMKDILSEDIDKRISEVAAGLKEDYALAGDIYVLNDTGRIVASSAGSPLGVSSIDAPWVEKVLSGEVVDRNTHPSDLDNTPVISFAVPVKPSFLAGKTIGALVLEYRVEDIKNMLLDYEDRHLAIFDRQGDIVIALPEDEAIWQGGMNLIRERSGEVVAAAGHIASVAHTGGYYGFQGFGWTVVVAVDEDEALYPIKRIERASLASGTLGVFLIVLLVSVLARRTVRPIESLSETADRIAMTKDFSTTVTPTTGDEVGRLAEAFNHMIVEVKRYIQHIREMEEVMRRSDRLSALGELSAGMAHEIKNPLGVIKGSAEMLKDRDDMPERYRKLIGAVYEEAGRLEKFLETFLKFARPATPHLEPCNLKREIEGVFSLIEPHIAREGLTLRKYLDVTLPPVMTDGSQFHQVLVNLMINAVQATPEGGELSVSTGKCAEYPPGEESVPRDVIKTSVVDTGKGMPPEVREKIFNPFFTTKERGTGLGLTIVTRIVDGLGGWVTVEGGKNGGTVFNIYLPMNVEKEGEE
ncbi:MAG: ATP-binding protein [Thermodesulfobacteriota bacterium]